MTEYDYHISCGDCNAIFGGDTREIYQPIDFDYCPNCGSSINREIYTFKAKTDIERGEKVQIDGVVIGRAMNGVPKGDVVAIDITFLRENNHEVSSVSAEIQQ